MSEFTIIVPVYNEEENLVRLQKKLIDFFKISLIESQVLFIDDGSTDSSKKLIKHICQKDSRFKAIYLSKNYGLSTALKAGFDNVQTKYTGYIDADLQTSPLDFNLLLKYRSNYDLIIGRRQKRNDTYIKKISSKIANSVRIFFTKDGISDTGCPLKVIRTSYAQRIPMFKGMHRFLPAMVLLEKGKVKEIEIQHYARVAGKSKFGLHNRFWGPLSDCFAYLWMKRKYIHYEINNEEIDHSSSE